MQLPDAVSNVLDAGGIPWSPAELAAAPAQAEVHPVVLQDATGRLLALVAADSLLDLDALNRCTGRELLATPAEAVTMLCAARGLHSLPAVPQALDLPVLVDQRLVVDVFISWFHLASFPRLTASVQLPSVPGFALVSTLACQTLPS